MTTREICRIPLAMKRGGFADLIVREADTRDPDSVTIQLPRGCNNSVTLPRTALARLAQVLSVRLFGYNL